MTRAYTNLDSEAQLLAANFERLHALVEDDSPEDIALCEIETFVAVALRVMKRTNPSKVRDCARTVEIKARLDGTPIVRGAI